jgi:hypothetical protein
MMGRIGVPLKRGRTGATTRGGTVFAITVCTTGLGVWVMVEATGATASPTAFVTGATTSVTVESVACGRFVAEVAGRSPFEPGNVVAPTGWASRIESAAAPRKPPTAMAKQGKTRLDEANFRRFLAGGSSWSS